MAKINIPDPKPLDENTLYGGTIDDIGSIQASSFDPRTPTRDLLLMWLGQWRDHLPPKAVSDLQDILGVPEKRDE